MSSESTIEKAKEQSLRALRADAGDDHEDANGTSDADDSGESEVVAAPVMSGGEKVILNRPSSAAMVGTIAKRELRAYLDSAITYIVVAASLVGLGFYFFAYKSGFWQVNRVTMMRMFDSLPAVLCAFVIPLFTMRALSDEKRVGTIELLITMPVKDSEVILGKYVAALGIVTIQLLLIVLYPLAMFLYPWQLGPLDWGSFWVGMLGLWLLSAAGTAVGLMFSSFTESQILSFFGTAVTLTTLYFFGQLSLVEFAQGAVGDALAFISVQSRFEPFSHGLIDTRAVIYFVSVAVFALLAAFRSLESRKWT